MNKKNYLPTYRQFIVVVNNTSVVSFWSPETSPNKQRIKNNTKHLMSYLITLETVVEDHGAYS